jgi:hypothetical protein
VNCIYHALKPLFKRYKTNVNPFLRIKNVFLAEAKCAFNYNMQCIIYVKADPQPGTSPIGYMYEFDCKEIIPHIETPPGWNAVAFEHQASW